VVSGHGVGRKLPLHLGSGRASRRRVEPEHLLTKDHTLGGAERFAPILGTHRRKGIWIRLGAKQETRIRKRRLVCRDRESLPGHLAVPILIPELRENRVTIRNGARMKPSLGKDWRLVERNIHSLSGITLHPVLKCLGIALLDHAKAAEFALGMI